MSSRLRASRLKALVAAPLSVVVLQAFLMSAHAAVQVSGAANALTLEASDASLEEVLAALGRSCGLQYRYPADFSRSVSGTFAGSLRQVLSRLLQGTNFVVESSASGTKVVIYDLHSAPVGGNSITQPVAAPKLQVPAWRQDPARRGFPPFPGADAPHSARAHRPPAGR